MGELPRYKLSARCGTMQSQGVKLAKARGTQTAMNFNVIIVTQNSIDMINYSECNINQSLLVPSLLSLRDGEFVQDCCQLKLSSVMTYDYVLFCKCVSKTKQLCLSFVICLILRCNLNVKQF